MERVLAHEIRQHVGECVRVEGWLHAVRRLGGLTFLIVRDRSGQCQAVGEGLGDLPPRESVIRLYGEVRPEPRARAGVELQLGTIETISAAIAAHPFELNKWQPAAALDRQLQHRAFSLRHPRQHAIFRVQAALVEGFRKYLTDLGFLSVQTPKIVATGTEGGANLFPLEYFGRRAFLAQSPQFYKQMLVGAGFERVFEVGPVYRAEPHHTARHLNEYVSLDVEMGFVADDEDLLCLEEALLRAMFEQVRARCADSLDLFGVDVPDVREIPRLPMADAQRFLAKHGKSLPEGDLDPEAERLLCQWLGGPAQLVFITEWPKAVRPFYALEDPAHPGWTRSFDLLFRGLEVTTGGLRSHRRADLEASLRLRGLDPQQYEDYLEIFGLGMPPHGGFAIGLERLTARLLGLDNVREASFFPRDRTRLTP